jgi:hypothetical protein
MEIRANPNTYGDYPMMMFINLCIHWAGAALTASYMRAESYGAEPSEEEAMRIANIYLTSGTVNHLWMIKDEFHFPIGEVAAVNHAAERASIVEFCSEEELASIRQHHEGCGLTEDWVKPYYH